MLLRLTFLNVDLVAFKHDWETESGSFSNALTGYFDATTKGLYDLLYDRQTKTQAVVVSFSSPD